jgi:uncharacterized protein (UPF0332 family)
MAEWRHLAAESAAVARKLAEPGEERSSVSRAYYAAYSRLVAELRSQGMTQFGARANPSHAQLPRLVRGSLARLDDRARREISQALRRLRTRREAADYQPRVAIDATSRREVLRDLRLVERALGGAV